VEIKDCLARCIPRALGQVKVTFIPVSRKANYKQAKGYHPISLLRFMQKMMPPFDQHESCFLTELPSAQFNASQPTANLLSGIHLPAVEDHTAGVKSVADAN